jgi:hypothetical protein
VASVVGTALYACVVTAAQAQRDARPDDYLGLTQCDNGVPVTSLREDVARSDLVAEIEAHEAVHREQAHTFPSCEAFLTSLHSARRVIDAELPAYCAQFRVVRIRRPSLSAAQVDSVQREFAWRIAAAIRRLSMNPIPRSQS